jgi:hypothetical protein
MQGEITVGYVRPKELIYVFHVEGTLYFEHQLISPIDFGHITKAPNQILGAYVLFPELMEALPLYSLVEHVLHIHVHIFILLHYLIRLELPLSQGCRFPHSHDHLRLLPLI